MLIDIEHSLFIYIYICIYIYIYIYIHSMTTQYVIKVLITFLFGKSLPSWTLWNRRHGLWKMVCKFDKEYTRILSDDGFIGLKNFNGRQVD